MRKINVLGMSAVFLLALNILSIIYLQTELSNITAQNNPTAMATVVSGVASFCINNPPSDITVGSCNLTMPWGYPYSCNLNATDPENNSILYQFYFPSGPTVFNVTQSGYINTSPTQSAIGNHTLRIIANDLSGCADNVRTEDFAVEIIDSNHPPYLIENIPNQTISRDTTYSFFLDNYFEDIDGDLLAYIVSQSDNLTTISIDGITSLVSIRGIECGASEFFFVATDPDGLTATSNSITYTVINCPQDSGTVDSGGGGGGGGGGGSYFECTSDWRCAKWSSCAENGTRTLRCIDYKGCNPDDYIRFFSENCTYVPIEYLCEEKWDCSEWSTCLNETHTRKCIDKNSCGTTTTKPSESEQCVPIPSCFNGIQDGAETGVDCGGQCGSCSNLERPTEIDKSIDQRIIIAAIITIAAIGLVIFALRKQLKNWILSLINTKRRKKMPIYLTETQKQKMLNIVYNMQEYMEKKEYTNFNHSIPVFMDLYFTELLEQINIAELKQKISKLQNKQLESIILDMHTRLIKQNPKTNNYEMQEIIDELFTMIYIISSFEEKDALVQPKERTVDATNTKDKVYQKLSNVHITLEFRELNEAKNLYKDLLEHYNTLEQKQKIELYDEMMIIYNLILYMERFY